MANRKSILLVASAALVIPVAAAAHHSFAAQYDSNKPITLRGTIVKMEWTNPHGHLWMDVKAADGKVTTWEIETAGTGQLVRRGWKRSDLPAGKEIVVRGYLARDGTLNANGTAITLVDRGVELFSGSSGTGAPEEPPPSPQ